jgi:predicted GNAT family acetyltransferase
MKRDKNRTGDIVIRQMCIDDYDMVIQLWKKAGLSYRPRGRDSREKIDHELKGHTAIFLVAEKNGRIIGSAFGTHDGRKGWINRVAVMPGYRRKGVARELVEAVEHRLVEYGIEIIACLIEGWNKTSLAAFKRMGYVDFPDIHYLTKRKHLDV